MPTPRQAPRPNAPSPGLDRLLVLTWRTPRVPAQDLEAALLPMASPEQLYAARQALGANGVCYMATCQRVVWILESPAPNAVQRLRAFYAPNELTEPESFTGFEAIRHLAYVASSLDSLVPGEPQILGQFKRAVAFAASSGLLSRPLRSLLGDILRTAKAVRSQTKLFQGKVSLLSLAEPSLRKALEGVTVPHVAVCGTGEMGAKAARLVRRIAPQAAITCVGRDVRRAESLAASIQGTSMGLTRFVAQASRLDALVLAMAPYRPIITAQWLTARCITGPLTVIDLGLPRNAEVLHPMPPGLAMHQLDELASLAAKSRADRGAAFQDAVDLLDQALGELRNEYELRAAAPRLQDLSERFERVAENRWVKASVPRDGKARKWYDQTVRALLHEATQAIKEGSAR